MCPNPGNSFTTDLSRAYDYDELRVPSISLDVSFFFGGWDIRSLQLTIYGSETPEHRRQRSQKVKRIKRNFQCRLPHNSPQWCDYQQNATVALS